MYSKALLSSVAILSLSGFGYANADEPTEDLIAQCASQTDAELRIACLEAALRGEAFAPSSPVAPETKAAPIEKVEAVTLPSAPIKTVTNPAPMTGGAEAEELGAEQVRARAPVRQAEIREATRQSFTVSSTRTVPYEKLEITLANGQVWRQIKGDSQKVRIPRKHRNNLTAEIWNAPISGYKLRLAELKRTIRVERLK
jgi:hypothetical protein